MSTGHETAWHRVTGAVRGGARLPPVRSHQPLQRRDELGLPPPLHHHQGHRQALQDLGQVRVWLYWLLYLVDSKEIVNRLWRSEGTSMLDLVPVATVVETRTDFVTPTFSSLLSAFGGALGLWLGLGVVQLVQVTSCTLLYTSCNLSTSWFSDGVHDDSASEQTV